VSSHVSELYSSTQLFLQSVSFLDHSTLIYQLAQELIFSFNFFHDLPLIPQVAPLEWCRQLVKLYPQSHCLLMEPEDSHCCTYITLNGASQFLYLKLCSHV